MLIQSDRIDHKWQFIQDIILCFWFYPNYFGSVHLGQ